MARLIAFCFFNLRSRCLSPTIRGGRAASTAEQAKIGCGLPFPNGCSISCQCSKSKLISSSPISASRCKRGASASSDNCRAAASKNCSRNRGKFSSRKLTPAAISCPPNFSSVPPHSVSACTIEQSSMLRPLPFPAPLSSNPMIIVGR